MSDEGEGDESVERDESDKSESEEAGDESVERDEFDEPIDDADDPAADSLAAEFERLEDEVYRISGELSRFEEAVERRTVKRPSLEAELRRYVRQRMRRNRARGWGPYLVLLYGTIMTLGAFYFLAGGWAILAMIVVWLSTLGLYVVMVAVGLVFNVLGVPGRLRDAVGRWRAER